MWLPGYWFGLSARTLLTGTFVACSLAPSGRPVTEVTVDVIDRPVVARFCGVDGVDGRWRRGTVCVLVLLDPRVQFPNALLEVFDGWSAASWLILRHSK